MSAGRFGLIKVLVALVLVAIVLRVAVAVLPFPLRAERRRVELSLFVGGAPSGLQGALGVGELLWHAGTGVAFGRIVAVRSRPAVDGAYRPGWDHPRDILVRLAATGRYRAGSGLFLGRNLAIRVGESYPLRTTLGAFWGRVERVSLGGRG